MIFITHYVCPIFVFCVNAEERGRERKCGCVCVCARACLFFYYYYYYLKVINLFIGYFAWHILKIVCVHVVLNSSVGIVFKILQIMSV